MNWRNPLPQILDPPLYWHPEHFTARKSYTRIQEIFGGDFISVSHRPYRKYRNEIANENFSDYSIRELSVRMGMITFRNSWNTTKKQNHSASDRWVMNTRPRLARLFHRLLPVGKTSSRHVDMRWQPVLLICALQQAYAAPVTGMLAT